MSLTDEDIACENPRAVSAVAKCYYRDFLSSIGSIESSIHMPKRHLLTFCDIAPHWVRRLDRLPLVSRKPDYHAISSKTDLVCIKTGEIPANSQVLLLVGIRNAERGEDLSIWCNCKPCGYLRTTKIYPVFSAGTVYVYTITADSPKRFSQIIEFASNTDGLEIDYVEIRVHPAEAGN